MSKVVQSLLIKELLMGFCLGTANIIPGVSGGTFLLIFQIYERVFTILGNINKTNIIYFLSCIFSIIFKAERISSVTSLVWFFKENDFIFLFKLLIGAAAAIIFLSNLMKYLIVYHFSVTYALFFGLILISIIIPVKMLTQKKAYLIIFIILGAVSTIYVSYAVNPYEKVKMKSDLYETRYLADQQTLPEKTDIKSFSLTGQYTVEEYLYAFVCGAIAVSAMVLPGISGSLVLILMGEYFVVVSAISGLKSLHLDQIAFLASFGIGIVLGGLFFAKLVNEVLRKYYNATMAFLMGLMIGSLYALWPFKKSIIMARQYIKEEGVIRIVENARIYTNLNEVPPIGPQLYLSVISFVVGCIIMFFFIGKEDQI